MLPSGARNSLPTMGNRSKERQWRLSTIISCLLVILDAKVGVSFQLNLYWCCCRGRYRRSVKRTIFLRCKADDDSPEDPEDSIRREILSLGPSSAALLSSLSVSEHASAAGILSSITAAPSPGGPFYDPDIPFSSVRRYKTITLPYNGLKVLLVSDKRAFRAQCSLTVNGAGQFSDPNDLPGLGHLMEHMVLSYNSKSTFRQPRDFEEWLSEKEGASNAFTANQRVCFHFSCPSLELSEALQRFAGLFVQQGVESVCRDKATLAREVRRVNSELDFESLSIQEECITKQFVNLEHPYSRFSKGSLDTLERIPNERGIDVGSRLIEFYKNYYLPSETVLVVIGSQDVSALERWVTPFAFTMSQQQQQQQRNNKQRVTTRSKYYPGQFLQGNWNKQVVLYRNDDRSPSQYEKLVFEWTLDEEYTDLMMRQGNKKATTGPQVAFVLSQILGRRGPGSLYRFLNRRGWIPSGTMAVPRITLPVDVSGFQIVKLEITITVDGFLNRSNIVAAVYDTIETLRDVNYVIPREIIAQCSTVAKLFGYILAPRPPDAIELAFDAQVYGLDAVRSGRWYRFPSPEDRSGLGLNPLRRATARALSRMSDPANAVVIATCGEKTTVASKQSILNDPVPPISASRWIREPISGALFYFEDMMKLKSMPKTVLTRIVNREELLRPVLNPLIPTGLRPPRLMESGGTVLGAKSRNEALFLWNGVEATGNELSGNKWTLLTLFPGQQGLPLPRSPPEPSCRCAFVVQLLSSRPARADVRESARAELWKLSLEMSLMDLADFGAAGGLAYDISFNQFGLRLSFLGISQTLPSYARRLTRRLASHSMNLLSGPEILPNVVTSAALATASKAPGMLPGRRRRILSNIRSSKAYDAAAEGIAFLRSCTGAVCFAQEDLLRSESIQLLNDLQQILKGSIGSGAQYKKAASAATPSLTELVYKPVWKPRYASACPTGVSLMSDACGRIPR